MESPFTVVRDPVSRAAVEEILLPGAHKYRRGDESPEGALSEPIEFLLITAAYLREGVPGGIKQELMTLSADLPDTPEATALYRSSVDAHHAQMPRLIRLVREGGVGGMRTAADIRQFCIDAVRQRERTLLAAHVVVRALGSRSLADMLLLPADVSQRLPELIEQAYAPRLGGLSEGDPLPEALAPFVRGTPNMLDAPAIAAAQFLRPYRVFRAGLTDAKAAFDTATGRGQPSASKRGRRGPDRKDRR